MKRIITLSLLLGLCMILQMPGLNAQNPVQPTGSGTNQDPYVISTLNNLYWLSINTSEWSNTLSRHPI